MRSRSVVWLFMGLLTLSLSGCWDDHPLDNQGIVVSLGISPEPKTGDFKWTFTFPNVTLSPSSLASIKSNEQYYRISVDAPTFAGAVTKAQQESSRIVYLGQLHTFIWPNTLSWQQLWPVVSALNSQGPIPKTFWVMAATPSVKTLMTFVSPQVVAPRSYLATYFDCIHCQPFLLGQHEWEFWSHGVTPGISPYVPLINLRGHKLAIRQILVYPPSGQPVLYSTRETTGFGFLSGKIKRATVSLDWNGNHVGLTRLHDSHHITVHKTAKGMMVDESIRVTGFIDQTAPESQPILSQNKIRELAQKRIIYWCLTAIHKANETRTDPFGYGQSILWQQGQRAAFLPIHAHITVSVSLKGEGMLR